MNDSVSAAAVFREENEAAKKEKVSVLIVKQAIIDGIRLINKNKKIVCC